MNYKYRVPPCYGQLLSHLTHMNFRVKTDLTLFHFLLRCTLHPLVEVLINKWSGNLTIEMKSWCIFTMSSIEGTFILFFSFYTCRYDIQNEDRQQFLDVENSGRRLQSYSGASLSYKMWGHSSFLDSSPFPNCVLQKHLSSCHMNLNSIITA